MRVQSYLEMLTEYGIHQLDPPDEADRTDLLGRLPYSVIVEGGYAELESLEKWIRMTVGEQAVTCLCYGKTGYNFGFAEYFFDNEVSMQQTAEAVPRIYTLYSHSLTPDKAHKSMGYDHEEISDPNDPSAIIFTDCMYTSSEQLNAQVRSLIESNEQFLKSKARLQQDLLGVKKSLAEKEQAIQEANHLADQREQQLAESKQVISELRTANQEQATRLLKLQDKTRQLEKERQHLLSRSWWQRLFGR